MRREQKKNQENTKQKYLYITCFVYFCDFHRQIKLNNFAVINHLDHCVSKNTTDL